MRAIVLREALVAARKPALVTTAILCAVLLALFPIAWGARGLPTLDGTSLYDQQFRFEWILLLLLLPWTAARVVANQRADDLVSLSAMTAIPPSRVLLARLVATMAALAVVAGGALPVVISAQQMSAIPMSRVIADQLALLVFVLPVAVVTVWWMQTVADRLLGWLASAATTLLLVLLARLVVATMDQVAIALAVCSLAGAAVLLKNADVWWRYLAEQTP
jgi:hypothetical protein